MHHYTARERNVTDKTFALYGSTMRFMQWQVEQALLDQGLSCSLAGEKLRAACRKIAARAEVGDLLLVYLREL